MQPHGCKAAAALGRRVHTGCDASYIILVAHFWWRESCKRQAAERESPAVLSHPLHACVLCCAAHRADKVQ